jgi:hypothetical protein
MPLDHTVMTNLQPRRQNAHGGCQVAEPLTSLRGVTSDPSHSFEAATLDIPGVWAQAGHNEVAWCNQLLRSLSVLLLSLAEARAPPAPPPVPLAANATNSSDSSSAGAGTRRGAPGGEGLGDTIVPPPPPLREEEWQQGEQALRVSSKHGRRSGGSREGGPGSPRSSSWARGRPPTQDEDASLIVHHLKSRAAHALAWAPAAARGAAAAAAVWPTDAAAAAAAAGQRALASDRAAAAAAAAQAAVAAPLLGPAAALDPSVGPTPCKGPALGWYLGAVRREAVQPPSRFFHGSSRDDAAGTLYSWQASLPPLAASVGGAPQPAATSGAARAGGGVNGLPGAGGLLLVTSTAQPCEGFRLWLELEAALPDGAPAPRGSNGEGVGGTSGAGSPGQPRGGGGWSVNGTAQATVELSHAAAPLPGVSRAAALKFKNPE